MDLMSQCENQDYLQFKTDEISGFASKQVGKHFQLLKSHVHKSLCIPHGIVITSQTDSYDLT